jgi:hypothetical protein
MDPETFVTLLCFCKNSMNIIEPSSPDANQSGNPTPWNAHGSEQSSSEQPGEHDEQHVHQDEPEGSSQLHGERALVSSHLPDRETTLPELAGLSPEEVVLLTENLTADLSPEVFNEKWANYQETIDGLLIRMGKENGLAGQVTRLPWVRDMESFKIRLSLLPMLGDSVQRSIGSGRPGDLMNRLAGECSLMELSAAAGYRTFCFPPLVRGLLKSGKMRDNSSQRMLDTFDFLNTMVQYPADHPRTVEQLDRTNGLHKRHRVAGSVSQEERDLFKYIGLNMFYIGPRMRPDLTPKEKHAICGLTVLVSSRMGHQIEGSVLEFDDFIDCYEAENMFNANDNSAIRRQAVRMAQESQAALSKFPVVSKERIHGLVPHRVKKILEID